MVEGTGFKQLMNYIEPAYVVPSRTHITSIICKKYHTIKEEMLSSVESILSVSLTTDIWTSRAVQAYITVTIHFITKDWVLDSKVLVTREMMERRTSVHIAENLRE